MPSFQPFDAIAAQYDSEFTTTAVGQMQRQVVWDAVVQWWSSGKVSGANILELNCGTGADTIWLARQFEQCSITATDISAGMVDVTRQKITAAGYTDRVKTIQAGFDMIPEVNDKQYDFVLSNFAGLNCVDAQALRQLNTDLAEKMHPGGLFFAVVLGRFCWWETLYFLLKGKWSAAFRRRSRHPVAARLDASTTIDTWYYSPNEFRACFNGFEQEALVPVGIWLPPSYLDPMFKRIPSVLKMFYWLEKKCRQRCWALAADHYLIVLKRKTKPVTG
jgi:SAM-dependent methyltransferase